MEIEQRVEIVRRLVQELQAQCGLVVAAEAVVAARRGVLDPVVAILIEERDAARPVLIQRAAERGFDTGIAVGAGAEVDVAFRVLRRLLRIELDHARRRVAAEQRALRAAQYFDLIDVEYRKAFEDRILEHDVVVHERYRLRGVHVEIGIAEAADIEAWEGAAERGFDQQARHAARKEAHVVAAGFDDVEFFRIDRGDRLGHFLHVLDALFRRHRDLAERLGRIRLIRGGICRARDASVQNRGDCQ